MEQESHNAVRFSMLTVLSVTGYIAIACAMVLYTNNIAPLVHMSFILAGWILWRYAYAHFGGLLLTLIGFDLLACVTYDWVYCGYEEFSVARIFLSVIGSLIVLSGLGLFIWNASRKGNYCGNQSKLASWFFSLLAVWWVVVPIVGDFSITRRRSSDIASNNIATAKAISMVEEAKVVLGKTPSKEELKEYLKEPFPSVRWDRYSQEIGFKKTGEKTFELSYTDPTVIIPIGEIVFDSAKPEKGWYSR